MFISVITDCQDANAMGRKLTRASSLFGFCSIPVPVSSDLKGRGSLEAAGTLIDILDSCEGRPGVVLVNVAPRSGQAKKWPNGTPFGYFYYRGTLVCTTVDGDTLSLVKHLDVTDKIRLFDIPTVMGFVRNAMDFDEGHIDYIVNTQFRSYEFLPRVAKWVWDKVKIPVEKYYLDDIEVPKKKVWFRDSFGNLKTTILPEDIGFEIGKKFKLANGQEVTCQKRLKDVPDDELALIVGSSGIRDKRFLELVVQGNSAAYKTGFDVGSVVMD